VLEVYEKLDGRESEGYANVLRQLSKIYETQKDYEMAANYLEECICKIKNFLKGIF
jgi:Tetratricopeptide repeat